MGLELTFQFDEDLTTLLRLLATGGAVELFLWSFELTLLVSYFFSLNATYYLIFALHSLHTVTWLASILLNSSGHGVGFDAAAVQMFSLTFTMDLVAFVVLAVLSVANLVFPAPSGAGKLFDFILFFLAMFHVLFSLARLITSFQAQRKLGEHRAHVQKFLKLSHLSKYDGLHAVYVRIAEHKGWVRELAWTLPFSFVVGALVFYFQRVFFGEGFRLLLLPLIPLAFTWLLSLSVSGSRMSVSFPPDGFSYSHETYAVMVTHFVTSATILGCLFASFFLPHSLPGATYVVWWSSLNWKIATGVASFAALASLLSGTFCALILTKQSETDALLKENAKFNRGRTGDETLRSRQEILKEAREDWSQNVVYYPQSSPEIY